MLLRKSLTPIIDHGEKIMRYYRHLYLSEGLEKKKDKIIRRLEEGRFQPGIHLVTLAEGKGKQLEIFSSLLFLQPSYPKKSLFVVGLAKDYEDALELVEKIVREVYNETKGTDIRSYILDKEQEE